MSLDLRAQNQALRAAMDRLLAANAELADKVNAQAARAAAAPPPAPTRALPGAATPARSVQSGRGPDGDGRQG